MVGGIGKLPDVARAHESLWLWVGGGLTAVGAALVGVAGGLGAASKVLYSLWTGLPMIVAYVMFGLAAACLGCAARGVPFPFAVSGQVDHESITGNTEPSVAQAPTLPPPVEIRLMPERDMITERFGLVAMNPRASGEFSAEVIGILDQDGREVGSRQGWRIPWLKGWLCRARGNLDGRLVPPRLRRL